MNDYRLAADQLRERRKGKPGELLLMTGVVLMIAAPFALVLTNQHGEKLADLKAQGMVAEATVKAGPNCILVETPRRSMNRLISSVEAVKAEIDRAFIIRAIRSRFAAEASPEQLQDLASGASLKRYKAGELVFQEGDEGDG